MEKIKKAAEELIETFGKQTEIQDKRISLLTETLESRYKDIETLKAEINRQNNIIVQNHKTMRKMAHYITDNTKICLERKDRCPGVQEDCKICTINYFEEVKE